MLLLLLRLVPDISQKGQLETAKKQRSRLTLTLILGTTSTSYLPHKDLSWSGLHSIGVAYIESMKVQSKKEKKNMLDNNLKVSLLNLDNLKVTGNCD
jgi:hypothetical protein